MKHRNAVLGSIAAASPTFRDGAAAHAQGREISRVVQIYAGYLIYQSELRRRTG
jgi:hypothetical protein